MRSFLLLSLLVIATPLVAQQQQRERAPNERLRKQDDARQQELQQMLDLQEEEEREKNLAKPSLAPPEIVPEGWVFDFDYKSDLFQYLMRKHQAAALAGKNTYVYLFADWNQACKTFRETADNRDYKKLFANEQIIMIEYVYLKRKYRTQLKQLPVFLLVHENGSLGPESARPVASMYDHPRKAFHSLRKFFGTHAIR